MDSSEPIVSKSQIKRLTAQGHNPHVKIRAGELTLYTCPVADGEAVLQHAVQLCPFCKGPLE